MKRRANVLANKAMGILLAVSVIASMILPLNAIAAESGAAAVEDDTNMFVGKINGEDVLGYLDTTYGCYLSGKDYNASFVTFDENGAPQYKVYMRIDKDVPTGTYSDAGEFDRDKLYIAVYTQFNVAKQKFSDYYTFRDSDKSWTVKLVNSYNNKLQVCVRCQGSGRCAVCSGTGSVY